MAANKTYIVIKDGETLKELKTLSAAKKLADEEGAQVLCEDVCVYWSAAASSEGAVDGSGDTAEGTVTDTVAESHASEKYTLTSKMNIRKAPSMDAEKTGIAQAGTVVEVTAIENGWLCLTDGTFILYEDGRFARKN